MALAIGALERCLETLAAVIRGDEVLSKEFEDSTEFFFRGPAPAVAGAGVGAMLMAARRHLEWFLIEFHSPRLRGSLLDQLSEPFAERIAEIRRNEGEDIADALEEALDALTRSHAGIFEVEEVRKGAGAWLRDLTGFGSFAMGDAAVADFLRGNELVVGRLYPAGDGIHLASPAAAILASADVTTALRRDLEAIRESGPAKIVRVSQGELEAMFFGAGQIYAGSSGPSPAVPTRPASKDPIGDSLALLRTAGLDDPRARAAVSRLAREPRDPDSLVHGASDALASILEELAFDTDIDLEKARTALLEAWELLTTSLADPDEVAPVLGDLGAGPFEGQASAAGTSGSGTNGQVFDGSEPDDDERKAAVEEFAAARAQGGDPGELLRALQLNLGLDPEDATEPELPAPDFPGVVGAMIEEMKWELGATDPTADVEALEPLRHFADFARPIGVFEELRGHDMFQFATFWLQEKEVLTSDAEAVALVEALRAFCNWALDAHEVDVGSEFLYALDGLQFSLPRMRHANARLSAADRARGSEETGDQFEIVELEGPEPASFETSSDRVRTSGGDVITVMIPAPLRDALAPGDRLRGEIELSGQAHIYRCYPPEAKALAHG